MTLFRLGASSVRLSNEVHFLVESEVQHNSENRDIELLLVYFS